MKAYIPYRNIRDVLAIHTKVARQKPALIYYSDADERTEFTYDEFVARSHQVANLLFEDLEIRRGDSIAATLDNTPHSLLVYFACWVIGAKLILFDVNSDVELPDVKLWLVKADSITKTQSIVGDTPLIAINDAGEELINMEVAARSRPTTFLGDDSGAKAGDLSVFAANEQTATLDDPALQTLEGVVLTQSQILERAFSLSLFHAVTGNHKIMVTQPVDQWAEFLNAVMTPLFAGGIVLLNQSFDPANFWKRVVQERANIASVSAIGLSQLVDHSRKLIRSGETPYGHNIHRLNLTRFRHFFCHGDGLTQEIIQSAEDLYGFTVMPSYSHEALGGIICAMPIDLAWTEHQQWLIEQGANCIGTPLPGIEMTVLDAMGAECAAEAQGEIAVRAAGSDAWIKTGDRGFYLLDSVSGRRFFYQDIDL